MKRAAFELTVVPREGGRYGVALAELHADAHSRTDETTRPIVRVWGAPFEAVFDRVVAAVKRSGSRPSDLNARRTAPFRLDEETGVRLGLLLLAVKPLRKMSRVEAIRGAIETMEPEEAYYWFSKCSSGSDAPRAARALRVLLASN